MGPTLYPCRLIPQMDTVLGHLSQVMLQEGHRLKAWGFLGTGTGAELLQPGEPYWTSPGPPGKPGSAFRNSNSTPKTPFREGREEEGEIKRSPWGWEGLPVQCPAQKTEVQKWEELRRKQI